MNIKYTLHLNIGHTKLNYSFYSFLLFKKHRMESRQQTNTNKIVIFINLIFLVKILSKNTTLNNNNVRLLLF